MMTCTQCGEDERHCHCRRPIFDGDLEDEADCLRDWRRDASAEAALPLPGLEPGPDTISPDTLAPQGGDNIGMAATACEGTAPKDGTGKSVREPAASTLAVDTNSRLLSQEEPAPASGATDEQQQTDNPINQ